MTQEDKELLLKDLSARLTYGVKIETPKGIGNLGTIKLTIFYHELGVNIKATERDYFPLDECKPYLRPMSSMTEEEKVEYYNTMDKETQRNYPNSCDFSESVYYSNTIKTFDWLNAHHFDYRGLIEKGLAIAVTEENNPYKE